MELMIRFISKENMVNNMLTFHHRSRFSNTSSADGPPWSPSTGANSNLRYLSNSSVSSSCKVRFNIVVADVAVVGCWKAQALARNDAVHGDSFGGALGGSTVVVGASR
jgi:hypothetical protein